MRSLDALLLKWMGTAAAGLSLMLGLVASGSAQTTAPASGAGQCQGAEITIGQSSPTLLYFPLYVALGSGAFEREGLKVVTKQLGGGTTTIVALAAGNVDMAVASIGPVLAAAKEGGRVKAVAALVDNPALYVAAKKDAMAAAGITPSSSFKDKVSFLKGKRLGLVSAGGGTDQLARHIVKEGGLDPDKDVRLVTHDSSSTQVASFVADRVDAVFTSAPIVFTALDKGKGEVLWNLPRGDLDSVNNMTNVVLAVGTKTLTDRSAVIGCAVKAMDSALKMLKNDYAGAAAAAKAYFNDIDAAQYDQSTKDMVNAVAKSTIITEQSLKAAMEFISFKFEGTLTDFYNKAVDSELARKAEGK